MPAGYRCLSYAFCGTKSGKFSKEQLILMKLKAGGLWRCLYNNIKEKKIYIYTYT